MIKIFPTIQIKELDAYTIENEPIASIDLMERASQALAKAISERWGAETPFTVFAGPGNNGGDALAVSRLLAEQGYRVEVYLFNTKGTLSPDCETNKERLARVSGIDFHEITTQFVPPVLTAEHVVVDGLFGSGLNKPLSGGFAAVVKYINSSPATVVASVLNIILDYLFIFPFGWGMFGAAFASAIGTTVGALMIIIYLSRRNCALRFYPVKFSRNSMKLMKRNVGYMCRLGSSAFLCEVAIACMMFVGNLVFIHYLKEDGVAAFSIAAFAARGKGLEEAVRQAKVYISKAIYHGKDLHIGHGNGPLCYFFSGEINFVPLNSTEEVIRKFPHKQQAEYREENFQGETS